MLFFPVAGVLRGLTLSRNSCYFVYDTILRPLIQFFVQLSGIKVPHPLDKKSRYVIIQKQILQRRQRLAEADYGQI